MADPSGADALANTLLTSLIAGKNFSIPVIDLDDAIFDQPPTTGPIYEEIEKIEVADLTTGDPCGDGVFDKLMQSLTAHLKVEFAANRISGAEYTKAYIGIVGAALQTANQFLLTKDQAYWQSLMVQAQAKTAEVGLVTARAQLAMAKVQAARAQYEAATAEAGYALTKMKIATEDQTYENLDLQGEGILFTNENILPRQRDLLQEQIEVQRAQTLDTRTDNTTIVGSIGKQKDLYSQQITSYQRDSEYKAAKLWTDAWITQKTVDEGLLAPTQFTNTELDEVLTQIRANLNLD
jgi:hypothetical protein